MANKTIVEQKLSEVNSLAEQVKTSKALLVISYSGLSAVAIAKLRRDLHEINAKMFVAKNNIYSRACKAAGIEGFDFKGSVAIICAKGDEVAPFKIISDSIRDSKVVKYVDGILEGNHVPASDFDKIASLPGREQLYSMFLSVLQGNLRNFLYGLVAVSEQKNA
jgi:large subunit ribosomal protein L10